MFIGAKRGQKVVKVINVLGMESATIQKIVSVKDGKVDLKDSILQYWAVSGKEVDPAFDTSTGISSRIIHLEV